MRVGCWNVNSVKARHERLMAWLVRQEPDVLCLQELKVVDEAFPVDELRAAGYRAAAFGQKAYNGVAIVARQTPQDVRRGLDDGEPEQDARLISAEIPASFGNLRVICVYVPNGQEVGCDKWHYKLRWLERLRAYLERHHTPEEPLILCGDFNCAPEQRDVAEPERWRDGVLTHVEVRRRVEALVEWGLVDTLRLHEQGPGPYSWWDYRRLAFPRGDGLRIDQIYATPAVAERCVGAWIDREERKGKKPSDHAPVVADLEGEPS